MTPIQAATIRAFRSRHAIQQFRDWDDDLKHYTLRCRVDGLRVYKLANGSFRHDTSDVKFWESGQQIDWSTK